MMTPKSATELAMWVALNHPQVFVELSRRARGPYSRASALGFLGDDAPPDILSDTPDVVTVTAGGPDTSLDTSNFSASDWANYLASQGASVDTSALFTAPDQSAILQDVAPVSSLDSGALQSTATDVNAAINQSQLPAPTDASGTPSWLSSIGSGLASAVSGVGKFLGSPQGLTSLAGVAGAYFTTQAQQAVLQTQVARAQAGQSPAPIGYAYNAAGQLVPAMVNPATGTVAVNAAGQPYAVTPQTLAAMQAGVALPSALTQYWPWALLGGGVLLILSSR